MLSDIVKVTDVVFKKFIPENIDVNSSKKIYDVYRKLEKLIDSIQLVSEHYLALSFEEEYLQNSSFGDPSDKWRYFLNKDLEYLNQDSKEYLLKLDLISSKDDTNIGCHGYVSQLYKAKTYYAFVRDDYNVGYVEPCGFSMISQVLVTNFDSQNSFIEKFNKVDLSSYKGRVALQSALREKQKLLQISHDNLKQYMLDNYVLEDLL